jgi:hypothetical protein
MERLKREGVKRLIIEKSPTQAKYRFTVHSDITRGFLYISLTKTKKLKKKLYSKVIKLRTIGCKST